MELPTQIYKPLVSVIILTYKNNRHIYEAIDSVLQQNYSNIELIISDDCSEEFDIGKIGEYIKKNKTNIIRNVIINKNEYNMGTVKHINTMLKCAKGQIIKLLAADDLLASSNSIGDYVNIFKQPNINIVVAKWVAYDSELKNKIRIYPCEKHIDYIKNMVPHQLYAKLVTYNFLGSVGFCFRKECMEKINYIDETYILTEDWPTWLRILRGGEKIYFLDKVTVKYRLGGISNNKNSIGKKILIKDLIHMFEKEILPYSHLYLGFTGREVNFIYKKAQFWNSFDTPKRVLFIIQYLDVLIYRLSKKIRDK